MGTPLTSIVPSVLIPEAEKENIFSGMRRDWMAIESLLRSVLYLIHPCMRGAQMKKMKLMTFRTWMAKTLVSVGDNIIKLREERER